VPAQPYILNIPHTYLSLEIYPPRRPNKNHKDNCERFFISSLLLSG